MSDWDLSAPTDSALHDREVAAAGAHLAGKRVAMLLCGGIAAMRAPFVARALRREGADVIAYATPEALRYTTEDALAWATTNPVVTRLGPGAEHLSDTARFDAYLLPQATYNTINKLRHGIADTVVTTTLASALGRLERRQAAVLLAPAMHGTMHNAILRESLETLQKLGVTLIAPRQEDGKDKIPDDDVLVAAVCRATSHSPLRGRKILVTGGPTPVPIDGVRRLTNKFQGKLGAEIARELHLRGAGAYLIHGQASFTPPAWLPHVVVHTYDEYVERVLGTLGDTGFEAGIFTAAVADYRPDQVYSGKIASGGALHSLNLVPTQKVIKLVRAQHPSLAMITFKYEEGIDHAGLMKIAERRLAEGYEAVVANRGEESEAEGEQVAWLVTAGSEPQRLVSKPGIARALAEYLERTLAAGER